MEEVKSLLTPSEKLTAAKVLMKNQLRFKQSSAEGQSDGGASARCSAREQKQAPSRSVVLGLVQLLGCAGLLLPVLCLMVWSSFG